MISMLRTALSKRSVVQPLSLHRLLPQFGHTVHCELLTSKHCLDVAVLTKPASDR